MKLKCLHCGHEFDGTICFDNFGWHSSCEKCNGSFDVDVPTNRIIMAFADDSNPDDDYRNFVDYMTESTLVSIYGFDTPEEFIEFWKTKSDPYGTPDSMWYFVLDNCICICSGACDPNDIEIFEEHWNREFR